MNAVGPSRFRRRSTYIWLVLVVAGVALSVDGLVATQRVKSAVTAMRLRLTSAQQALTTGDNTSSSSLIREADAAARRAAAALDRPSLFIAAKIPGLRADIEAVKALVDAGENIGESWKLAAAALDELGGSRDRLISSLYAQGDVDVHRLRRASADLAAADASLMQASDVLASAPNALLASIDDAVVTARRAVAKAREFSLPASVLAEHVPSILGIEQPRSYLVAFQALGEARATGGVIGTIAIVTAEEGRITLDSLLTPDELYAKSAGRWTKAESGTGYGPADPVSAPAWFREAYAPQRALTQWQQANVSPSYPIVASVLRQMYETATREAIDGVVFLDPVGLAAMLAALDPVPIAELGINLTPDNAVDVLLHRSYTELNETQQDLVLKRSVASIWRSIASGDVVAEALVSSLLDAVRTRRAIFSFARPSEQAAVASLDAVGYPPTRLTQMVFHNNYGLNKVDYFLHRTIETDVHIADAGSASVRTRIVLRNDAPNGPPSDLIGYGRSGVSPGTNRMLLSTLLPQGSESVELAIGAQPIEPMFWTESDRPAFGVVVSIPPGRSRTVFLHYELPTAVSSEGSEFDFALVPQAVVNPDEYLIRVFPPEGHNFKNPADGSIVEGAWVASGTLTQPRFVELTMELRGE